MILLFLFSQCLKCFHPIRMQNSLMINISGTNQLIAYLFYIELVIKGKQDLGLLLLVGFQSVVPPAQSDCGIVLSISQEESNAVLVFQHGNISKEDSFQYYHFWLGVARCSFCPIRLQDYLIHNISGKNQSSMEGSI